MGVVGRLVGVSVLVGMLMTTAPFVEAMDWSRVVYKLKQSTVAFVCSEHQQVMCTAFSINQDQGLYMTAFHCIQPFEGYAEDGATVVSEVPTLDGKPLDVVFSNQMLDVAIVRSGVKRPALQYRDRPIKIGNELGSYGYGYGMAVPIFRTAVLSAFLVDENKNVWVLLDNSLVRGMSGGPLVDTDGRVVGVNQSSDYQAGRTPSIWAIQRAIQFWEAQ